MFKLKASYGQLDLRGTHTQCTWNDHLRDDNPALVEECVVANVTYRVYESPGSVPVSTKMSCVRSKTFKSI
jgi:hypothetical protein